jgi:LAO/AO transport system kinase
LKREKPPSALNVRPGAVPHRGTSPARRHLTTAQYIGGILSGDRVVLSRAITLVESSRADHQKMAGEIISSCLKEERRKAKEKELSTDPSSIVNRGNRQSWQSSIINRQSWQSSIINRQSWQSSVRVGITGPPGVGKSTFIEALGKHVTGQGHRLAVLAIDPSSTVSKGSILGDKTRMEELSADPNAFIRPSPSAGTLGGVARKTRETVFLCEAAGFDVIFIETVGVGQSETEVRSMVDFFLLLMLPGAGDELQGIKRGIMEMADMVVINKADGDNLPKARTAASQISSALHLFSPSAGGWIQPVELCSATARTGIPRVWDVVCSFREEMIRQDLYFRNRVAQNRQVFLHATEERLREKLFRNPSVRKRITELEKQITEGTIDPYTAADEILAGFL